MSMEQIASAIESALAEIAGHAEDKNAILASIDAKLAELSPQDMAPLIEALKSIRPNVSVSPTVIPPAVTIEPASVAVTVQPSSAKGSRWLVQYQNEQGAARTMTIERTA